MLRFCSLFRWHLLIVFLVLFSWSFAEISSLPPDISDILKRGRLKVAMVAADQIPFFFEDGGVLKGTDVDLAKGIANSLGVAVEFNRDAKSFNDLIPLVASGQVDMVISKLSRTLKRSQQVLFTTPYNSFYQALALNRVKLTKVAETDFQIKKFIKNFNEKIGVIGGSSYVTYAKLYFPKAEIVEYPSWDSVMSAVVKGEIIAAYRDEFEIKKALRTNPDLNLSLKLVVLNDLRDDIAIAFRWSSANLRDFVNIYLSGVAHETITETFSRYVDILKKNKLELK